MVLVIAAKTSKLGAMKRLVFFLLLIVCSAAGADPGAYRVEVIVFRNLEVTAEPALADQLRSFTAYPDLLQDTPAGLPETAPVEPPPGPPGPPVETAFYYRADLPDDLQVTSDKSTLMDNVWKRLRSSKGYRPLLYAGWQQNRVDYYPPLHVHNQQVLDSQLRPPTPVMVADLGADDPLSAYRSNVYQLDGSIQLRRSRFLHVDLDLELREEAAGPDGETVYSSGLAPGLLPAGNADSSKRYRVYSLDQNRQVQTDRMQYFDTPHFGALVLVTNVEAD